VIGNCGCPGWLMSSQQPKNRVTSFPVESAGMVCRFGASVWVVIETADESTLALAKQGMVTRLPLWVPSSGIAAAPAPERR
jgi:hypothetical protein